MQASSSAAAISCGLARLGVNVELDPHAAAHHVDRLWRLHGGDWNEPQMVAALVAGAAQIAWHNARRHGVRSQPPFALTLAAWPRCLRMLLPDDSRFFGVAIVWLRHFEALMPTGAPPCHLVLPSRKGEAAPPRDDTWLWGDEAHADASTASNATRRSAA